MYMTQISEDLIIRFINNACSDAELVAVRKWIEESDENMAELFETEKTAHRLASLRIDEATLERARAKVYGRIEAEKRSLARQMRRRLMLRATGIAAMVAVVLFAGLYFLRKPDVKMMYVATTDQSMTVVLPDSSVVYLNCNSQLAYPERFASNCREVELTGEGYFEVSRDSNRPFRVSGQYLNVEVLGTHFDFVSRDSINNSVSLIEGSVEVTTVNQSEGVVLEPGQKAVYSVETGHLTVQTTNAAVDASWHDRMIPFENANLNDIVEILRQLYGRNIELGANVDLTKTYSGVTVYCGDLDSTLTRLSNTIPIRFTTKGDKTVIYPR